MIREVAGRQNHSVKLVRKLQHKKFRRDRGLLVCEGMDLLMAAVESGAAIRDVLVRPDLLRELPSALFERAKQSGDQGEGPDIGVCDQETIAYASSLGGAADVIFTCVQPQGSLGDLELADRHDLLSGRRRRPGQRGHHSTERSGFWAPWSGVLAGDCRSVRAQGHAGRHGRSVLAAGCHRGHARRSAGQVGRPQRQARCWCPSFGWPTRMKAKKLQRRRRLRESSWYWALSAVGRARDGAESSA